MSAHTPGPWTHGHDGHGAFSIESGTGQVCYVRNEANALLIAASPTQHAELLRYLPIIERAEADPELWARLTEGTGIATANGYRAAIAAATGAK